MRRLNLGCGFAPLPNAINHDLWQHADYVDVCHDLNDVPWPWDDNSFDFIQAHMVFEHLWDMLATMNECWRILAPGGQIDIVVPHWQSPNVAIDFTHVRGFHPETFELLDPERGWGQKAAYMQAKPWRHIRAQNGIPIDLGAIRIWMEARK